MPNTLAIVIADRKHSRLGLPSHLADDLGGQSVLQRTVRRVEQIKSVRKIVVLHPQDQDLTDLVCQGKKQLIFHGTPTSLTNSFTPMWQAARKWALPNWRGGLGGATCYDELLPVKPTYEAALANKADAIVLVGGDWPLVDPDFCEKTLALHLEHPDDLQMTINQAPPGLSGLVISMQLLKQMSESDGTNYGSILAYSPSKPQADPIGRDVCYSIPHQVRSSPHRFIYDNSRSIAMIKNMDIHWEHATALEMVQALKVPSSIPQQITIELTTRRVLNGPIIPQHYQKLDRPDMSLSTLENILKEMPAEALITFGGLGDAMLHEHWIDAVKMAHDYGAFGICLHTDLQREPKEIIKVLELPIDILCVHFNADTQATYQKVNEPISEEYKFKRLTDNFQWLLNERNRLWQQPDSTMQPGLPWMVPHLTKVADNLKDMETFFDRWMHFTKQAVILPSQSGCGLIPELGPVRMAPPTRVPCRQLPRRISIHSDGTVAQCDQDWLAKSPIGTLANGDVSLPQLWKDRGQSLCDKHNQLDLETLELCQNCHEWHRP